MTATITYTDDLTLPKPLLYERDCVLSAVGEAALLIVLWFARAD